MKEIYDLLEGGLSADEIYKIAKEEEEKRAAEVATREKKEAELAEAREILVAATRKYLSILLGMPADDIISADKLDEAYKSAERDILGTKGVKRAGDRLDRLARLWFSF